MMEKTQFVVENDTILNILINKLKTIPTPFQVVISDVVKERKLSANAYYFMRVDEIAEQAFINGKQYSTEIWHEYLKKNVLDEEVELKDGTMRSKWTENIEGSLSVISTSVLSKTCFYNYTIKCESFGAELGVMFKDIRNVQKR